MGALVACPTEEDESSDASLQSLTLNAGSNAISLTPAFASAEQTYTASVVSTVATVTVAATETDGAATVSITPPDADAATDGHQVSLEVGDTVITIVVTAEDDSTTRTYTITVNRAAVGASSDASLSALTLSDGTLSPTFASAELTYTATVSNSVESVTVTATPTDTGASTAIMPADTDTDTDGHQVSLRVGDTDITITVTAADNSTMEDYTITVTRTQSGAQPSAVLTKTDGMEADANPTNAVFTLTLTNAPSDTATVTYTLSGAIGDEYTTASAIGGAGVSGTLSTTANSTFDIDNPDTNTEATITLVPMSDADGSDETITLTIVSITFADSGTATDIAGSAITGTDVTGGALELTIVDDEEMVTVTPIVVMEGDSGTTDIQVMVVADGVISGGIEVTLTPGEETASVPTAIDTGDFTLNDPPATTVTLTDTTAQTVTIGTVTGDDLAEGDFTIPVTVTVTTTPTGRAVLASGSDMVDVVITDDDPATMSYEFFIAVGMSTGPTITENRFFGIGLIIAHAVESGTVEATFTISSEGSDTAEPDDFGPDFNEIDVVTTSVNNFNIVPAGDADTDDECLRGTLTWTVTPARSLTGSLTSQEVTDLTAAMTALVALDPANDNPVRLAIEDADDGDEVISPACPALPCKSLPVCLD